MDSGLRQPLRIETAALVLRPLDPGDAAVFFTLSNEPAFRKWLPSQVYADKAEARDALEFLVAQFESPGDPRLGPYVLAVEHRADRSVIGHVGLSPFEGDVEIGFAVAEAYQRQGLAVETVLAACRWAFSRFGLRRILGITAQSNHPSRKVLARCGFAHRVDRIMSFQGTEQAVSVYSISGSEASGKELGGTV